MHVPLLRVADWIGGAGLTRAPVRAILRDNHCAAIDIAGPTTGRAFSTAEASVVVSHDVLGRVFDTGVFFFGFI